jgi:hypothetical protein
MSTSVFDKLRLVSMMLKSQKEFLIEAVTPKKGTKGVVECKEDSGGIILKLDGWYTW